VTERVPQSKTSPKSRKNTPKSKIKKKKKKPIVFKKGKKLKNFFSLLN